MLNQVILVGRVEHSVQLESRDDGSVYTTLKLSIESHDSGNERSIEIIPCILWSELARNAAQYLPIGSTVGVKARIRNIDDHIEVHAEKLTFINTKEVK